MEKLSLRVVLDAERQALAVGPASLEKLREAAHGWLRQREGGVLEFEEGVEAAIERITGQFR